MSVIAARNAGNEREDGQSVAVELTESNPFESAKIFGLNVQADLQKAKLGSSFTQSSHLNDVVAVDCGFRWQ